MNCILIKKDSRLKSAILEHYKNDYNKTNIIFNDIITRDTGEDSFQNYLRSKNEIETYENGEPTIKEFTDWVAYIEHQNKINKRFSTNSFDSTTKEFLELSEGFTVELMNTLFNVKGFTPNDLFEKGALFKVNDKNTFNTTLAQVKQDIRDFAEDSDRKEGLLEALELFPGQFFTAYRSYLKTTFQVDLEIDDILTDAIENSDTKETRDSAFNKSSHEFDQKGSAPNAIKILIAGLPDVDSAGEAMPNELGLVPAVDYDKTFNFIQQSLVELPGDIDTMITELNQKADIMPALEVLTKRLNFGASTYTPSSTKRNYDKEQLLRTQFVNQFNKTRNEFTLHVKREDGTISIINSNLDKVENMILKDWENNLKEIIAKDPKAFQTSKKLKGTTKKKYLESIGVKLDNYSTVPTAVLEAITNYGIEDLNSFNTLYSPKKGEGVRAQLRKLATIHAKSGNATVDFQHFNAEGKIVYGITLNTYLSALAKELRYFAGTDELQTLYPEIFEADYNQNSRWLSRITSGEKINVGIFDGFTSETSTNTKASKDLGAKDLNVQRMTGMLMEGKFSFLRSADRSTENYFSFSNSKELVVTERDDMQNFLAAHLEDEIAAMSNKDVNIVNYDKNNKDFRAFHINKNGVKRSLLEEFNPKITTARKKLAAATTKGARIKADIELGQELNIGLAKIKKQNDLWQNPKVVAFIGTMMDQIVAVEKAQLETNGVLEMRGGKFLHIQELVDTYKSVDTVIETFALNAYASAIEQTKVFAGDLAFFKTPADIFKRMSMLNSTKESARTDIEMDMYLNSLDHRFSNREVNDSTIKTITINDVMSKAADYAGAFDEMLRDVFGKDYKRYAAVYNDINEADGMAYMTYDEYRIASIRFGEWMPADEDLYNRIADGHTDLVPEVMRRATVKKYQYTGKLVGPTDVNAIAVRKFSIMPLVPGAIPANSVLQQLNQEMLKNQVGMAFYESAAKAGYNTFVNENGDVGAHSMYDANGKFNLDASDHYDVLDYKYMGNQLKIHNDPKEKITASTQKRKLVESNFYENGKLVDEGLKDLLDTYNEIQSDIVQEGYDKMMEEEIIDSLIQQGLEQGYTTNELKSLQFLKELPIVDALPNKQRLESLILSRLSRKVISNKRKGDSVAQVPDVGFEVNDETAEIANRHNLQFYRKSKDGSRMLPMEIMIALPTELIGYVRTKYGNGVLTQDALDAFNQDIADANVIFEETGDMTELDKLTTYVGYRVPNQAASSSDVAKVKKFLAPYMGAAVVVPKQIVAKTGSDFDIDKLFLYKPHIKIKYKNEKEIQRRITRNLSPKRIHGYLKSIGIEVDLTDTGALNRAFIAEVLESDTDLDGEIGIYQEIYQEHLELDGVPDDVIDYLTPDRTSAKNKQNLLLETEIAITLHKANWKQLLSPITDGVIMGVVEKIRKLRGEPLVKQDHISDVFTNAKNIDKFIAFLSGKGGVGQVAIHITNHVLAQKAGLKMKSLHNYFGLNKDIELGLIDNQAGQQVSEILSELLTAYVDIAKDPYILDINAIQSTANTILMMIRWGLKPDTIFLFMNQPIIRDYVKAQSLNESVLTDKDSGKINKDVLVANTMSKYGFVPKKENMISWTEAQIDEGKKVQRLGKIYNNPTTAELSSNIKAGNNAKNQAQMLDLFLEYQRQSKMFQKMISSTSPDTKGFKGISTLENQNKEAKEVADSKMFINYDKMFDSFIGDYQNVKKKYFTAVKDYFISQNPLYKKALDGLKEVTLSKTFGEVNKNKALALIDNEFVRFIIGRGGKVDFGKGLNDLMKGTNSIPKVVQRMQTWFEENDYENIFLEQVLPLINNGDLGIDNLKFKGKRLTIIQKETLEKGFKELKSLDESGWIEQNFGVKGFYQKLIAFQMVQAGLTNSPYNIMEAIPAEDYFAFMKDDITKFSNTNIGVTEFTGHTAEEIGEFVLHHPGLYYDTFGLPFEVSWDKTTQKFYVKMYGKEKGSNFTMEQMGMRHYYALYGTYPKIIQGTASPNTVKNNKSLKDIADATGYKYQLANSEVTEIRPELENSLTELLTSLGADIKYVDQIKDRQGNPINAYGRADLVNMVIEVTKGRNITTLPEEAAHIITGLLGKKHPLMKQMMAQIDQSPIYEGVKSEYANVYTTEEEFRFEAVGKLIAEHLIKGAPIANPVFKASVKNWFERLLRKIAELFSRKNTSKLKSEMDIFASVADKIRTGLIKEDIANSKEGAVDRRTRQVGKMFNMNSKGVMPESIGVEDINAELDKNRLPRISIHKTKEGYVMHRDGKRINPIQEYYDLRETTSQQELVAKFVRDDARRGPNVMDPILGERYVVDGKMVEGRVSDASSNKFASNKSKEEVEAIHNNPSNRIKADFGTYIHEQAEDMFNNAIDSDKPYFANLSRAAGTTRRKVTVNPKVTFADGTTQSIKKLTTKQLNVVAKSVSHLAKHINETQQSIDPDSQAIVRLENFVLGDNGKTGGTQDVTVIYSDGSVSIYDYKSISYNRNAQNSVENDMTVSSFKLDGFTTQISTYMKFLREEYGVTKFRDTRILPFSVQYEQTRAGVMMPNLANIEGFKSETEKRYLMPIPVVKELGENKMLNKMLNTLFTKEESLQKDLITNWGNVTKRDTISNELKTLQHSIKSIQVNSDLTPLIDAAEEAITNISQVTRDSYNQENIGELNKLILEVRLFNSFTAQIQNSIDKKDVDTMNKFNEVNARLNNAEVVLADKLNQALVDRFSNDINLPQEEIGKLSELFSNFSQINQPIFEAGRELVKKATGDTNREVQAFTKEVEVEVKELKTWAKNKGISLMDAYAKITNEQGDLIGTISKEFNAKKKEALREKDVDWLTDNFEITDEGKALYKEDLATFRASLKKGSKLNDSRTSQWMLRNDLSKSPVAWSNRYALNRYTKLKNEESHYSQEYKELLSPANAGLKRYYDFYIQSNRRFNEALAGHDVLNYNFVANIRKDLVDSVAQGDGIYASGKNAAKDFVAGLRVRQNDIQLVEGEETVIPLLYKDRFQFKDKDGNWVTDVAAKNADLTNNLILFSEGVFRKKNMLKIADITESLKLHIADQQVIKTSVTGKVILNEDGTAKTADSTVNADLFDVLTKGLVYGKRVQNKDKEFGIMGQQLSMNKSLQTAMSYMSTKSLAFNYVSGFGNAAAGMINTKIKSKSGLYYDGKQMNKSLKLLTTRGENDLANHLTNYFNVEKDHWVRENAAKLSASKLTKALTFDKWYILQQKGDELIANNILISMLQNYGVDKDGNVQRLAKLPEGSKSLMDRVDRSKDTISIEGLDNDAFDDFRNRVKYVSRQIKGTNTTEDLSKVQTDVRMKAFMHFRNWIAPMVKERFGGIGYTKEVQEFELGRYKGAMNTVLGDGMKAIPKLLVDIVTLGKIKYQGDTKALTEQYKKFKKDNPHLVGTKGMPSIDEYLEMRERALREGLYELKWVMGLALVLLAGATDWDDDGEAFYKQNAATRIAYKLVDRAYLELSFFVNPSSIKELLKSPIPVMQVLQDVQNLGGNTLTEIGDTLTGNEERDQTPKGHYTKKMFPIIKVGFDLFEDLDLGSDED